MKLIYLLPSAYLSAFLVLRTDPKKAALLLFSIVLLLTNGAATVRGQSALDGFDPKANGVVRVVVVQPDGKILLGGEFTTLSPNGGGVVGRNRIARLNADGTLDPDFRPNANGAVDAIVVQLDGKILVGGQFNGTNSIGGQTRNYIARLDATTGDADSFDPDANGIVRTIALQPDGKVLAGGVFTTIGGQTRNHIARLNAVFGAADLSFDPDANDVVRVITLQPDGKILVGGQFSTIGGQARNFIARLRSNAGLADSFNPNANDVVRAIAVQADGKILAGGVFSGASSIGGQTRNHIARLDSTTGMADSFNPDANGDVLVITVQTDGKILAGGDFSGTNSIGGQTRNHLARIDPATGLADSFDSNADDTIRAIAQQPDGKILAGGVFTALAPSGGASLTRNRIARLETDGRVDQTLNLSVLGNVVYVTAVQPDGKTLIGGIFTNVLGVTRNRIARLNTDGTLDTAFNPSANSSVYTIAVQADGKILVGGFFSAIGGQTRNHIGRVDATTGLADSFNPDANDDVFVITVQADGKILVGGAFANHGTPSIGGKFLNCMARLDPITGLAENTFNPNIPSFFNSTYYVDTIVVTVSGKILVSGYFDSIGGEIRNGLARLNATTGSADSWDPNPNSAGGVAIAVQTDGKVIVGGSFTSVGGQLRNRIARLDPFTGLADSFDPNADGIVSSIAIQADGKKLVSGSFTTIGGALRNHVARLDPNTGVADSFDPNPTGSVYSIGLQSDGKMVAAGDFTAIDGQIRNYVARISSDTAALQDLAVTQSSITWTRGGSGPQLRRATFEYSTNKVNYTFLGNGLASGSTWSITNLSLPTGFNIYVRARGYFNRSGYKAYSESITESVRNVALPQPTLTIQRTGGTNIVLSWPTNFTGYTLEASTNLNTNVWTDVIAQPVVSGTNNVVTNFTAAAARFYRLRY